MLFECAFLGKSGILLNCLKDDVEYTLPVI